MSKILDLWPKLSEDDRAAVVVQCRVDFGLYQAFVHGWEARAHQRPWVEALQALAIPPPCWDNGAWSRDPPALGDASGGRSDEALAKAGASRYARGAGPADAESTSEKAGMLTSEVSSHDGASCFLCRVHRQKRLLIVAFPGGGKTDSLLEFACWMLGRDPEGAAYGIFSYNDNIATERSMAVRDIVWSKEPSDVSERYALVFPGLKPAPERPWSQERWFLHRKDAGRKDPTFVACGLDGSINARRLRGGVIDDPHNFSSANSIGERRKAMRNWKQAVRSRFTQDAWMVCITALWPAFGDEPDMASYFISQDWPTLRTPALDEWGKSVWPYEGEDVGYTTEFFEEKRAEDARTFLAVYQGALVPDEDAAVLPLPKRVWEQPPTGVRVKRVIQSWDTAGGQTRAASETACTTWVEETNGRLWWIGTHTGKPEYGDIYDVIQGEYYRSADDGYRPETVLIEEASSGLGLSARLRRMTGLPAKGIPVGGKGNIRRDRVMQVARYLAEVHVPASASWWGKASEQILSFDPRTGASQGKDDVLMSAVQALHFLFPPHATGRPPQIPVRISGWSDW